MTKPASLEEMISQFEHWADGDAENHSSPNGKLLISALKLAVEQRDTQIMRDLPLDWPLTVRAGLNEKLLSILTGGKGE